MNKRCSSSALLLLIRCLVASSHFPFGSASGSTSWASKWWAMWSRSLAADDDDLPPPNGDDGFGDDAMIFCPQVWFPVYCTLDGLLESNWCEATADGYDPGVDCTFSREMWALDQGPCSNATLYDDPASNSTASTLACGNATYPSVCWASAAGLVPSEECTRADGEETAAQFEPFPVRCATRPSRPLVCGGNNDSTNRTYLNMCFARRVGGYNRSSCTRIDLSIGPS